MSAPAAPDPRCACGRPLAVSWVWRGLGFGAGPWRHTCLRCAPASSTCIEWHEFGTTAREAEKAQTGDAA